MALSAKGLGGVAGAVAGEAPDQDVAAHFGDFYAEQRVLDTGAGLVDRSNRPVVTVSGPDRLAWLHSLTTQHLSNLAAGTTTEALILSPHGHVEHHLVVCDDGTTTYLEVEPTTAGSLIEWLLTMRFLLRVEVTLSERTVLSLLGPESGAVLRDATGAALPAPGQVVDVGGLLVRRRTWPAVGVDLVVEGSELAAVSSAVLAVGARPAGLWAYEALRVAARQPRLGFETDHRTIPHEVGWLASAVHLDKGCYRGQETVARVHNLGRPPRRLVLLQLDGSESVLPPHGSSVTLDDGPVGLVTTSARHYEQGPIALALVKRKVDDAAQLRAGTVAAVIDTGR